MVQHALVFHLDEVERCMQAEGVLASRLGGEANGLFGLHPTAFRIRHSKATRLHPRERFLGEAWEIARPWFVDLDAPSFTMNAIHPGHWFQGEYDLVYRWSGSPFIVDLKASVGANDRSGDYVEQLKIYAMLWYATHGRQEQVAGLQIWYLGHPSIKTVDVPTVAEMEAVEHEMKHLWEMLKENEPTLEDCPPQPRPMRGFLRVASRQKHPRSPVASDAIGGRFVRVATARTHNSDPTPFSCPGQVNARCFNRLAALTHGQRFEANCFLWAISKTAFRTK